jgi:MoxR-like ATPase
MDEELVNSAMLRFFELRDIPGLKKKPSTSEFLDWLALLSASNISAERVAEGDLQLAGALIKNEQDMSLVERLSSMVGGLGRR